MTIVVIYLIFSAISGGVFMIHVHGIAHQFRNPGGFVVERMEGSGDYLLLFLRSAAEFDPGSGYVPVSEGHYILFRKDCPQKYRKLDGMFINDWMHFDFDSYDNYFENLGIPFNTPLALPDNKPIFDLFMDIYSEFFNDGVQHEFIMDHKANALFHKFSDLYSHSRRIQNFSSKYSETLADIRQKILEYRYTPSCPEEVAEKLNISVSYLQHIYTDCFGTSLHKDIIKGRIEHAAQLLLQTQMSVTDVAAACGYENLEHFSRQFKKYHGVAPSKFRR